MEGLDNFNGTKRYMKKDKRYCNHSTVNMHHKQGLQFIKYLLALLKAERQIYFHLRFLICKICKFFFSLNFCELEFFFFVSVLWKFQVKIFATSEVMIVFLYKNSELFVLLSVLNGKKNEPIWVNFAKNTYKIRECCNDHYRTIL